MACSAPNPENEQLGPVLTHVKHDDDAELSTSVLVALDSLPEFDAATSEEVLFSKIDPDALDALFRTTPTAGRTSGRVSFTVEGYHVSVYAAGDIVVRDRP